MSASTPFQVVVARYLLAPRLAKPSSSSSPQTQVLGLSSGMTRP
jgi:hypothetical protein